MVSNRKEGGLCSLCLLPVSLQSKQDTGWDSKNSLSYEVSKLEFFELNQQCKNNFPPVHIQKHFAARFFSGKNHFRITDTLPL